MPQDIVVQDREELIFLLCEAAEFEHAVMGTYLFAQWSLKQSEAEGVTADELAAIARWRASLRQVALEEMLHLTLVNNILAAIGAAPHLWRPAYPIRPGHFPSGVVMPLRRFSKEALDHFLYVERPEDSALSDSASFAHPERYVRPSRPDLLSPSARDYTSQGQLYHGIIRGLKYLSERNGETRIFAGHGEAQITMAEFGLPGLFAVKDLATAERAIEEIVTQGEGAPAHHPNSHYARFAAIAQELAAFQRARPGFDPARPVADNPVLGLGLRQEGTTRIEDPVSAKVADLGNAIYGLTMRCFAQVFAPSSMPPTARRALSLGATELMLQLRRTGEALTLLPMGPAAPGQTAGLNFTLPISAGQLVQSCATQILSERASELAEAASALARLTPLQGLPEALTLIAARFQQIETTPPPARKAAVPHATQVSLVVGQDAPPLRPRYEPKRCIHARHCVLDAPNRFGGQTQGPRLDPGHHSNDYIRQVAEACPSGAITYQNADGTPAEAPPPVNIVRVRENGPYALRADTEMEGVGAMLRATLCRCGLSKNKPFCDNSHIEGGFRATGEPETIPSDPLENRAGPLSIAPMADGPLQLSGNIEIICGTGRSILRTQTVRLCRCGGSATKPICDGSHLTNGFRSER